MMRNACFQGFNCCVYAFVVIFVFWIVNARVAGGDLVVVLSALQKCLFSSFINSKRARIA